MHYLAGRRNHHLDENGQPSEASFLPKFPYKQTARMRLRTGGSIILHGSVFDWLLLCISKEKLLIQIVRFFKFKFYIAPLWCRLVLRRVTPSQSPFFQKKLTLIFYDMLKRLYLGRAELHPIAASSVSANNYLLYYKTLQIRAFLSKH